MKTTISTSRKPASHWAPLILRAIVGYGFMAHGYAKLARVLNLPEERDRKLPRVKELPDEHRG